MKVKFQADNDLHRAIVRGLVPRLPSADFQSQPLNAVDDIAVLKVAAEAGRIVVSHDVSSLPRAFAEYRRTGHSPGVLLTPQARPLAETIEHLVFVWELTEAMETRAQFEDLRQVAAQLAGFLVLHASGANVQAKPPEASVCIEGILYLPTYKSSRPATTLEGGLQSARRCSAAVRRPG